MIKHNQKIQLSIGRYKPIDCTYYNYAKPLKKETESSFEKAISEFEENQSNTPSTPQDPLQSFKKAVRELEDESIKQNDHLTEFAEMAQNQ